MSEMLADEQQDYEKRLEQGLAHKYEFCFAKYMLKSWYCFF